jgi:hypothetical protein
VILNGEPLMAVPGAVTATCVAVPAVFVRSKFTEERPVAVAVTVYGPPFTVFAVNEPAEATPAAFVVTVIVFVLSEKVPDAPDAGAVNVTLTPGTGLPAASCTVTERGLATAVLTATDWGVVPELAPIVAGTCTTGMLTVPLVADALAPPPDAVAAFVPVGLDAAAGTATAISISGNDEPPATACVPVHVTAFVPEQLHPEPPKDVALNPEGSVSVTVVVPQVALDALPVFDTVTVSVPPVCPCVNVPLEPSSTSSTGVTVGMYVNPSESSPI